MVQNSSKFDMSYLFYKVACSELNFNENNSYEVEKHITVQKTKILKLN